MSRYGNNLPQLAGDIYLSDGGMETDLIFNEGFDLPLFSSFVLLNDEAGTEALRRYYRRYADIARTAGVGFILEAVTWRASPDWEARLGFPRRRWVTSIAALSTSWSRCEVSSMPHGRRAAGRHLTARRHHRVDEQTDQAPAYYGINCAHPSHFAPVLEPGAAWMERVRMLRANASRRSHAELDESDTLDDGDPRELGAEYAQLRATCPGLTVLGGCCGTDHRHVQEIARACIAR